MIKDQFLI